MARAVGAAEEVAVVNKIRIEQARGVFQKHCVACVGMFAAHVDEPCQPKIHPVVGAFELCSGEDFEDSLAFRSQETRTKAQARIRAENSLLGSHPAIGIPVQKGVGEEYWSPGCNWKAGESEKLGAGAFVKAEIGSLQVICELR